MPRDRALDPIRAGGTGGPAMCEPIAAGMLRAPASARKKMSRRGEP